MIDPTNQELERMILLRSFQRFIPAAWPHVEHDPLVWNWHMDMVGAGLQGVADGHILRLLNNIPPGHSKSILANVLWPAWLWARRPQLRMICGTYAEALTLRDALKCRQLMEGEWYQRTFAPSWRMSDEQNAKGNYQNTAGGARLSLSVGSKATGFRADILNLDDPMNVTDQNSEAAGEAVIWWYDQVMGNRLNDMRSGAIVLTAQRLRENDLPGHVLKNEPGEWTHICLPTEYEPSRHCRVVINGVTWEDKRKREGDLLFPERFPAAVITKEKRRLGSMGFAGQHQQRPSPMGGAIFRKSWFSYFEVDGDLFADGGRGAGWYVIQDGRRFMMKDCHLFSTADLALTTKEESSWTAIGIWAVTPHSDLLLLDVTRERLQGPDVENLLLSLYQRWLPACFGVEDKHYGLHICQKFIRAGIPLKELKADRDKLARAVPASVMMENGKIHFRRGASWLFDLEDELLTFDKGQFDDQVDMVSHAALHISKSPHFERRDVVRRDDAIALVGGPGGGVVRHDPPAMDFARPTRRMKWSEISG